MRPTNEANTKKKKPSQSPKQEGKRRSKPTRNEAKSKSQEKQDEGLKKTGKGRTQTATTQPPTHYESLRFVPGPQFGDPNVRKAQR
jgi:hypothetical protein